MPGRFVRQHRGVTLIVVAGVMAVLAALGAGFYVTVHSQMRSADRYSDSVRAELLAKAGLFDAIARLRQNSFWNTEAPTDDWFTVDYLNGARKRISFPAQSPAGAAAASATLNARAPLAYSRALGNSAGTASDRYTLNISDAAARININACDNLGVLLDNLCRVLGPPLVPADLDALQPRRWVQEGSPGALYATGTNKEDTKDNLDLYYRPPAGAPLSGRDGNALYGDGYAIARYRSLHGLFQNLSDVRYALTVVRRQGHPELEEAEREVKFAALRDSITIHSWVDTNTVCVGKFEWCKDAYTLIDRDKSWVADDPKNDPDNHRGSLRGSYVSIMNGHGAGQLRRIKTNGIDWVQVEQPFVVLPGPISSYMILAKEDALLDSDSEPMTDTAGNLIDDPKIDYKRHPLCIHRAPVNINTASDKVLAALFMGINVQHGTPLALGTDADIQHAIDKWSVEDPLKLFGRIPTVAGLRRAPVDDGKLVLDRPEPWTDKDRFGYIDNFGQLDPAAFGRSQGQAGKCSEAHELAYRIISARQRALDPRTGNPTKETDPDPLTRDPETGFAGYERGPFKSWDDLYFRVIKPWDDIRSYGLLPDPTLPGRSTIPNSGGLTKGLSKASLAPMLMAHFNSNTDLLKFNPNIEWIDRWGRNFTSMEPVMQYGGDGKPLLAQGLNTGPTPPGAPAGTFYFIRNMRYRFEEMVDKSDLNRSTTEFTLDSGGVFEIESCGEVVKDGIVLSERKMQALVQVYDVWRESTQRQFVQGTISKANNQSPNWPTSDYGNYSGSVGRDAINVKNRLALTTLPEPLVPLQYRLKNNFGGRLEECVDDQARNARGRPKDITMPDVIANNILPAIYDGQIVLATNVCGFDPAKQDTFLASFNGDLDTDTCVGNGREQAKTPENSTIRVCDTISLLGLLNDTEIDIDPYAYPVFGVNVSLGSGGVGNPLGPLGIGDYGNNVQCRMGDLRADGVYCGILGTSCKDGTLKYPIGKGPASAQKAGAGPAPTLTYENFVPSAGSTVGMWFKPLWHANDHLEHEFFNAGSNGPNAASRGNKITKNGYVQGTRSIGWPIADGTLWAISEDYSDGDMTVCVHSGTDSVPATNLPPNIQTETPSFHTQPFRWGYVGGIFQYNSQGAGGNAADFYGFWQEFDAQAYKDICDICAKKVMRPYISTYRYPEGPSYSTENMWMLHNGIEEFIGCDLDGQPAAYPWEKNNNPRSTEGCFSMNNVNEGGPANNFLHIYRQQPTDTAYSVIDEWKLSKRALPTTEIGEMMTTSRYYLPAVPGDTAQQPTFTSQTLLQSLHGSGAKSSEAVTLVRVSWNVFTPRFMHEYKIPGTYRRQEVVGGAKKSIEFCGPFDYSQYNADIDYDHDVGWKSDSVNPRNKYLGVNRPPPRPGKSGEYIQAHYSKGVEIEVLNGDKTVAGFENSTGNFQGTNVFRDPDVINSFLDPNNPKQLAVLTSDRLRYRVRFRYPVYRDADPKAPGDSVDPKVHFLLDTPVFDDISITYMTAPRFYYVREVTE